MTAAGMVVAVIPQAAATAREAPPPSGARARAREVPVGPRRQVGGDLEPRHAIGVPLMDHRSDALRIIERTEVETHQAAADGRRRLAGVGEEDVRAARGAEVPGAEVRGAEGLR